MALASIIGVVTTPSGAPRGASVLIDLITQSNAGVPSMGFVPAASNELGGQVAVTADPDTGVWFTDLTVNADIDPPGSYYRAVYVIDTLEHPPIYFQVTPGGGWVHDHLFADIPSVPSAGSSGRQVAYTRLASTLATTSTSLADVSGAAITVPVGTMPLMLEFYASYMTSDTADKTLVLSMYDVTGAAEIGRTVAHNRLANGPLSAGQLLVPLDPLPAAGLRTYKMQWSMGESGGQRNLYGNGFFGSPTVAFMRAVEY